MFEPIHLNTFFFIHDFLSLYPSTIAHNQDNMSQNTQRPVVFFDVNIGETPAGRMKMELFSDIVPKYVSSSAPSRSSAMLTFCVIGRLRTSDNCVRGSTGVLDEMIEKEDVC